ncbi:MAG: hypothetical protein GEU74_04290 [Nitriliruptorales bacterium]|nr:hypothetical protein [Nitriliruptorales bacterium]
MGTEQGTGVFRLPLHRCARGHIHGWRPGDDFLADLTDFAIEVVDCDDGGLNAGTVAPQRRMLGPTRCGNCRSKLRLRPTGQRLRATVRRELPTCADPVTAELDVPEVVCSECGARAAMHSRALADTPADIETWFFQLLAAAMPLERASEIQPRGAGRDG